MYKAGATFRDKNRVRELHLQGHSADQISAIVRLKVEQVKAIVKQVEDGSLKVNRAEMRDSGGSYGEGAIAAESVETKTEVKTKTKKKTSSKKDAA